ncbi:AraC family transcriptional regulator [Cohnella hashimotonis]|uniref:AraC family transcriptional regulator n=1 Tax=Cohnella hashimotonis TaxID=2826895 RepID=A0ABT6TKH5_9BACL|nr:AraC family transcriptional regulator [Cohnella hashimotonis]
MEFESFYRLPDEDDKGFNDPGHYLLINSVGYYKFESFFRMTHRRLGRKDFYLSYNHAGPMTVRLRGQQRMLAPGSFFLLRPFEEQYYGHHGEQEFFAYWVHFTGYGAEELLHRAGLLANQSVQAGADDRTVELFEAMMEEVRDKKPGYELASSSLLSYLFSMIARRNASDSVFDAGPVRNEIYESIKYIHDHYAEEMYVGRLAELAHLSTDRFTALFKRITSTTPQQYILRFRLQRACELMKRTNMNIKQISGLTGFEDQLYFSRIFKKYYRETPSQYRARFHDEG